MEMTSNPSEPFGTGNSAELSIVSGTTIVENGVRALRAST